MMTVKVYRPDGTTRAFWDKPLARVARLHGVVPERASHVVAIAAGPRRGYFHVDLSPLALLTGNREHAVCLTQTFESHEEAVQAERAWLLQHWILEPPG
jgi:hypothetical protein